MPTTAAYAVPPLVPPWSRVRGPGLVNLGIPLLTAHFLRLLLCRGLGDHAAGRAGKLRRGRHIRRKILWRPPSLRSRWASRLSSLPFMFFYNGALLMDAEWEGGRGG